MLIEKIEDTWAEDSYGIDKTWDLWDDSGSISSPKYSPSDRQAIATEMMKGMVSSGLMESPQDMAKDAVRLTDALLAELRK